MTHPKSKIEKSYNLIVQTRILFRVKGGTINNYKRSIVINWTVPGKVEHIIILPVDKKVLMVKFKHKKISSTLCLTIIMLKRSFLLSFYYTGLRTTVLI